MRAADNSGEVLVLGGGPAGLAVGWALQERGRPYRILEAAPVHGGNSRTLRHQQFQFDTGPHRFHDRDPEATRRVMQLLGPDLRAVAAPSRIYWKGRFVDFPLKPFQALTSGGLSTSVTALMDLGRARLARHAPDRTEDFAAWASAHFGRTIAEAFLIPFSEKLWGLPAAQLSPSIAGRRLPGFTLMSLMKEVLLRTRADHLEGRFLYPRHGYGQIVDAIAARLPPERLQCSCRVTRVHAHANRIESVDIEIGGNKQTTFPAAVVSTLPITALVRMMDPAPPSAVREAAGRLRFRDVILVAVFLDQASVSDAACIYFPDPRLAFTRAHEPRNRSAEMSPPGKTSLVVEFPCFQGDATWAQDDASLSSYVIERLDNLGIFAASRVETSTVVRLKNAYPVYSKDYASLLQVLTDHLRRYENLESVGRGGSFFYGHVHDFISSGFAVARAADARLLGEGKPPSAPGYASAAT